MNCKDCIYYSPQRIQGLSAEKSGRGYCRRHPPQISDRLVERNYTQGLAGCELSCKCSWWPGVAESDHCGEYRAEGGGE
jgi:hypothetical protein